MLLEAVAALNRAGILTSTESAAKRQRLEALL